ncbi:type I toxin-antitoxin system Fst family toxin [Enterococcus casseliflavus]
MLDSFICPLLVEILVSLFSYWLDSRNGNTES